MDDVVGFTHHDPLEDTESADPREKNLREYNLVSPITIRLRILKGVCALLRGAHGAVSPITIRLRILKVRRRFTISSPQFISFTHHDPLEDTERSSGRGYHSVAVSFHPSRSA